MSAVTNEEKTQTLNRSAVETEAALASQKSGKCLFGLFVPMVFIAAAFLFSMLTFLLLRGRIATALPPEPANVLFSETTTIEINTEGLLSDFVTGVTNGRLVNGGDCIETASMGERQLSAMVSNAFGEITLFPIAVRVVDTTPPAITAPSKLSVRNGGKINLLKNVSAADNSGEEISVSVTGEYSLTEDGTYILSYVAADSSGNSAECALKLTVYTPIPKAEEILPAQKVSDITSTQPYVICVYRDFCTVVIWAADENGKFTVPVHTFLCSPGSGDNTPLGTFKTPIKYEWRELIGNVYGQYSTRITGQVLFHSVPYKQKDKSTLKYWLYNILGQKDSMGCIRLTTADAKWIYDNCALGTTVIITADPLPDGIGKPVVEKIDPESPNRGWDPTDPDPANPWNAQ